jgi:hypothetical protein
MRSRIAQAAQPAREIEREFAAALKEDDTRPVPAVTERDAAPQP